MTTITKVRVRTSHPELAKPEFARVYWHHGRYHYRSAKERLFRDYEVRTAVINVSDPVGMGIASAARMPVIGVGPDADLWAESLTTSFEGTVFDMVVFGERHRVSAPLIGSFNVENALIAAGCCLALGLSVEEVVTGLGLLGAVPGRFESIDCGQPFSVVVDYAHTPDSLDNVLRAARGVTREARVI